jgi:16S rRNA (cytidine1402-2'-O)-methyltransferase
LTAGTLFVVATPIGNLEDLSPRARQTLQQVDVIAAEDTRHTGRLLSHFAIKKRQIALHDHNEAEATDGLVELLLRGQSIALVSDAGTPLVSDPGFRLVQSAHKAGITVTPIPGASAAIAAMSVAGLPSDRFAFEGFLPAKREARVAMLKTLCTESRTLVFFESVHRITDTLNDMAAVLGASRQAFIGREISKLHEQCVNATLQDLCAMLDAGEIVARGEFVVVVAGTPEKPPVDATIDASELLEELVRILPGSQSVDLVTRLSGRKRNDVYKDMLKLKSD